MKPKEYELIYTTKFVDTNKRSFFIKPLIFGSNSLEDIIKYNEGKKIYIYAPSLDSYKVNGYISGVII